jgi:lysophospholipase L1-like esterase
MSRFFACAIAMLAVFVFGAASCTTNQPFTGSGAPTIKFTGDSITVQSTPDINAHYQPTYDVGIDGLTGGDTWEQASRVAQDALAAPDVEIINLGTNDAARIGVAQYGTINGKRVQIEPAFTMEQVLARYDAMVAEFAPTTCLVFVTVNTHNPSWGPAYASTINDHLRVIAPHLVDWDAAWSASYFDGVSNPHPNASGRQALLVLEDQAIATCASTSTTTASTSPTTTPTAQEE